jgi:lipoic acid synthetase
LPPDPDEPGRVASAALEMGLHYVVITSVTRDDLNDGGAAHFASTVNALRKADEDMKIEVLTPDFKGDHVSVDTVLSSCPDVYNHNLETVPRLYSQVRQGAEYERSLRLLEHVKRVSPKTRTKSGLMLGLGEATQEVESVLRELRTVGCDFVTIGQYLRPGRNNIPVKEYIHPDVFEELRHSAIRMGFRFVASSPLTRSSMNAEEMFSKDRGVN